MARSTLFSFSIVLVLQAVLSGLSVACYRFRIVMPWRNRNGNRFHCNCQCLKVNSSLVAFACFRRAAENLLAVSSVLATWSTRHQ